MRVGISSFLFISTFYFITSCDNIHETPIAGFNYLPIKEIQINDNVSFENQSIYATDFFWFFGDSTTSNEKNPIHTYRKVGTYKITLVAQNKPLTDTNKDSRLTINDIDISSDTISKTITINDKYLTEFNLQLNAKDYDGVNGERSYQLDLDKDSINDILIHLFTHYSSYTASGSFINIIAQNGFEMSYTDYDFISWAWNPVTDTVYTQNSVLLPKVFHSGDRIKTNGDFTNKTIVIEYKDYPGGFSLGRFSYDDYGIPMYKEYYLALRKINGESKKLVWLKVKVTGSSGIYLYSCKYVSNVDELIIP